MIQIWKDKKGTLVLTYTKGFHHTLYMHDLGYIKAGELQCSWDKVNIKAECIKNTAQLEKWLLKNESKIRKGLRWLKLI